MARRLREGLTRWGRRAVTIPSFVLLFAGAVILLPVALPLAVAADVLRHLPFPLARCLIFFTAYLGYEVAGIVAAAALWLVSGFGLVLSPARFVAWHRRLQSWWARGLFHTAVVLFGITVELEEEGDLSGGPVLVFIRHASVADTVIPAVFLSDLHGLALRYVLKRELLWDPCLDIVGGRLPNHFVRRGASDGAAEVAAVARLADGLGPRDGVLIYPEGTRFTPAKRERALARLATSADAAIVRRMAAFRSTLPPRLGGPLALLERARTAGAIFCAHAGLERATTVHDLVSGALVHCRVRVRCWKVPAALIPRDGAACRDWFLDEWQRVDDWVGAATT